MTQRKTWNILENLNKQQKEAVLENDSNLLIIAGAGSGKTKTITHKIAYILENNYAKPYEIMALTFTNKAANEMKERIEKMVKSQVKDMFIGTFHAIALKILRYEGFNPTIYDTKDQEVLIKEILKNLNIDKKKYPPGMILSKISKYKLNLKKYDEIDTSTPFEDMIRKIYKIYEEKLIEANAMDFDNIILKAIELLSENEQIKTKYANRFKYIFIDEYQDTNYPQYIFIKLLYNGSNKICAVGDEDQSIYGFRGADVANIMNFNHEYDNCRIVKLEKNYRSGQNILDTANMVISKNSFRNKKELYSEYAGGSVNILSFPTDSDEAYFVAKKIKDLSLEEKLSDIAVLYRTNFQSRIIEDALMRHSIPYKIVGSKKFFDRKEIKDTLAYMKLLNNKNDDVSFLRAMESHPIGVGKKLIEKIQKRASDYNLSYFDSVNSLLEENNLTKRQLGALKNFISIFQNIDTENNVQELIDELIEKSGYKKYLEELKEYGRIDNIMELKNAAKSSTLCEFLESISLFDYSNEIEDRQEMVNLMTIHASKGLEFNSVFIVGLEEGLFPNANLKETELEMEEERRLFYVAITRAKENLYITYANSRRRNNQTLQTTPSRFLSDITFKKMRNKPLSFKRGDKIEHSIYGKGIILSIDKINSTEALTVNFYKSGIKKILSKDRNLKII